jgi:hypothetical protein
MLAMSQQKKASVLSNRPVAIFVRLRICPNFKRLIKPSPPYKFKPFAMRKFLLPALAISFLLACNNDKKTETAEKEIKDGAVSSNTAEGRISPVAVAAFEKLLGSFVGAFGDNKITLLITRADKDSVSGRSIVGGNDRPFTGTITQNGNAYSIAAKEPGDDPNDGVFNFTIAETADKVSGSWKPNDAKKKTKEYTLDRKKFEYRADVGSYPEASLRLLKAKDVENEMKEDLEFMRNEIFARHGYCFKKKNLRQQFENEEWYVPNTVDIKGFLTDIEKKNIELIKRYEKYAAEYGDEYGR